MTVKELINELEKLDQDLPVVGQSETCTWDIEPGELIPSEAVCIFRSGDGLSEPSVYPKALILGYKH